MKINYVIATYNGYTKRTHKSPLPKDVLKCHLEKILSLQNNLSQITIMKASSNNYYKDYYDIDSIIKKSNIPIKIIECENYGYSLGQWLKAYELYKNEYDYYLFVEDDYCANMEYFDQILIECYKDKFPKDVGVLCSLVEGSKNYIKGGYPIHFEGCVFVNKNTLEKLYQEPKWKGEPRKYLDLIDSSIDNGFNWKHQREGYIGGYYQITFSHLFTLSDIEHQDYLDVKYKTNKLKFPYWNDINNQIGGEIYFYDKGDIIRKKYTIDDIFNSPIIPIQLFNVASIKFNTPKENKPKIVFIIGMHRSGTSLLSNCLVKNGFSIGKTKNTDKNWQNPNGYFENDAFTHLHDKLLNYNNSSWCSITKEKMDYTQDHIKEYKHLLKTEFDNVNLILIKDPRLTFFVDFLKEVCTDNYEYNFLFLTRNKTECSSSLSKAQNKDIKVCNNLYDVTMSKYCKEYLMINYNDIIYKNYLVIKDISKYININLNNNTSDLVDMDLYRNRTIDII